MPERADRRRNRERLLATARDVVGREGGEASLEEIARRAGVGSATLHRHFGSRRALLEAVFHDDVEQFSARARELAVDADPRVALVTWLHELATYTARTRGLAMALLAEPGGELPHDATCHGMIRTATAALVERATLAGAVRRDVAADDLLILATAVAGAVEGDEATAGRLLDLALRGV